jgi:hypothetical protein
MKVLFLDAFDVLPQAPSTYGPQATAVFEKRFIGYFESLLLMRPVLQARADQLTLSHVREPRHIRAGYPPPRFGPFFEDFDAVLGLCEIEGLRDPDSQGYFAVHRSARFDVASVLCFTLEPDARLTFLVRDSVTNCRAFLRDLTDPETARQALETVRAA